MSHRVVELLAPAAHAATLRSAIETASGVLLTDAVVHDQTHLRALVPADHVEALMDEAQRIARDTERFRLLVQNVEAVAPAPESVVTAAQKAQGEGGAGFARLRFRISRDEIRQDLNEASRLSPVFFAQVVAATALAAIGMQRGSAVVVIAAMLIAPLLTPNIGLALAMTLGDCRFALRVLKTNVAGVACAIASAAVAGALAPLDPSAPEVASRVEPAGVDVVIAVAAGLAGALAFLAGQAATVAGVMVAVALLPPTVALGAMLVQSQWDEALGAAALLIVNIAGVNLAAGATFLIAGVRPANWWEAPRALRLARLTLLLWFIVLAGAAAAVYLLHG